ncbi:MAG: PD40 domain-containing protein [Colwellia sp.]|nr:PD40 domain-containing protein [Colwellia sp.]
MNLAFAKHISKLRMLVKYKALLFPLLLLLPYAVFADGTRLLRQPSISQTHVAFVYGGDIWLTKLGASKATRITSTAAVESDPHFSPDGQTIAFTSNRSGVSAVYTVPLVGGTAKRLSWHAAPVLTRGWTPDGEKVLYASKRETAPKSFNRLWTIAKEGGVPSLVSKQWGNNGAYSPNGKKMIIDRVTRWDVEWRNYRGGQNTPLVILNLKNSSEVKIPSDSTIDIEPVWLDDDVYFLSDRDWISNIWLYSTSSKKLTQITHFKNSDIKQLATNGEMLAFEQNGYLHTYDLATKTSTQLNINVVGDFPWAETKWLDVSDKASSASLSPTGKRVLMQARGEIFTVPAEHGNTRNITQSSDTADRAPIWSPKGDQIAWFSDQGEKGYQLMLQNQDGLTSASTISIGKSKMAWEPTWSPDGELIAFVDDDVRIRVIDLKTKKIKTVDVGGNNLERGYNGLRWSTDSQWLAYSKTASNSFRQIIVWSRDKNKVSALTNKFADSFSPSWDLDGKHLYFLASTDVALNTGWANTSSMTSKASYGAYVINLNKKDDSPFIARSDEEEIADKEEGKSDKKDKKKKQGKDKKNKKSKDKEDDESEKVEPVQIDFAGIERRIMALSLPKRNYRMTVNGPKGSVFIGERPANSKTMVLQKFSLEDREAKEYISGVKSAAISFDGKKLLVETKDNWQILDASKGSGKEGKPLNLNLQMKLDRQQEWRQMFVEAWRYQRDYFYDSNMHGRDWNEVFSRYSPLIPYIKHRSDLTYVLDQVNGELSVGHSFVFGGDFPNVEKSSAGLLGADLVQDKKYWQIKRIYTAESWNPELKGPLDQPGLKVKAGNYIVGINGKELTANDNPYQWLDGTVDKQTVLHINNKAKFKGAWQVIVKPIASENSLRQRAWVEDNRRLVDKLSKGKLAYVWVPNTATPGYVSFNRYFFAQQDKQGAVIDERFNGGGFLDDYMVDLMTRSIRASLTNEVPNGKPLRLPAGILGPKVLLINELSGSGGDFFPWVFRQQQAGKLIGTRTWGGLVKSSVHYRLVDGGALTAPDNAVFDPIKNQWVAENVGIAPDMDVYQDAKSLAKGKDPQLETAVKELLKQLKKQKTKTVKPPKFPTPAINPNK